MKKTLRRCIFAVSFVTSLSATASVWEDSETWSPAWEQKYSEWISQSFNEDFFMVGKYQGIPTDCADAVYMSRAIFAYENKLPFVIKDPTGGSSKLTNKMSRFDSEADEFKRVRKFLLFLADVASTKSLPNDSYPVSIQRDYVRPGAIWSRPRITKDNVFRRIFGGTVQEDPGHAELVKDVSDTGAVFLIGSTVPQAVRKLISTSSLVFMPVEQSTGLRAWMAPEHYSLKKDELPGYSLEQFSMGKPAENFSSDNVGRNTQRNITDWTQEVQNRLALRSESKEENLNRQTQNVCNLVNARVEAVTKGNNYRKKLNGDCMDRDAYDAFSTPSRDKRIKATLSEMVDSGGGFGFSLAQRAKKLKPYLDKCADIEYAPGKKISLYEYSLKALANDISSNPNDSLEARWGLADSGSNNCPRYE